MLRAFFINKYNRGDTIVEVLIAITIAAFAIGTSYSLANKSLQNAISARERNQALNIIDNQIADLKLRYKSTYFSDQAKFDDYFSAVSNRYGTPSSPYPSARHHYCLIDGATDPLNDATWLPVDNSITSEAQAENLSSPPYNNNGGNGCVRSINSTNFYIDISAQITSSSAGLSDPTVYKISVRWAPIGGSANAQAVIYYRLGAPTSVASPPETIKQLAKIALRLS